jgi:AcrR family transcriptional regulator
VIERAGVAKASLYAAFGSKEALVCAYLEGRATTRRHRIKDRLARVHEPRARILAVFDVLAEIARDPAFRGCAFVNASAEGPSGPSPVRDACSGYRAWMRELFVGLARDAGAPHPTELGRQLVLLYDGAVVGAAMDDDPDRAAQARAMAAALLATQLPAPAPAPARRAK